MPRAGALVTGCTGDARWTGNRRAASPVRRAPAFLARRPPPAKRFVDALQQQLLRRFVHDEAAGHGIDPALELGRLRVAEGSGNRGELAAEFVVCGAERVEEPALVGTQTAQSRVVDAVLLREMDLERRAQLLEESPDRHPADSVCDRVSQIGKEVVEPRVIDANPAHDLGHLLARHESHATSRLEGSGMIAVMAWQVA